jgi:site-specific DNA-methyltransferase (adenine-specific)
MQLIKGDCLEKLKDIPDGSIDMILTDPPYGTTACTWDTVIPLEPMWEQLKRVIKSNGAIVMTSAQPFTTILISSNMDMFRYDLKWIKTMGVGFYNANRMPLRAHEDIVVFYNRLPTYNPQKKAGEPYECERGTPGEVYAGKDLHKTVNESGDRHPFSWIMLKKDTDSNHPTQKPVKLMEYLILTYTQKGETVLDFTMGSGSTGVACVNTFRDFIGIELDGKYFEIAKNRIAKAKSEPRFDFEN